MSTGVPAIYHNLKFRLIFLREMKGLTREQLAETTGIGMHTILNFEHGRQTLPLDKLVLWAEAVGTTADQVIRDVTDEACNHEYVCITCGARFNEPKRPTKKCHITTQEDKIKHPD